MSNPNRKKLKQLVDQAISAAEDNYNRMLMACKGRTPAQMREKYGQSGLSYQEILDGYVQALTEAKDMQADLDR